MKRAIYIFLLVGILLLFTACGKTEDVHNEREEYVMTYEKRLNKMGVLLVQSLIDDEKYNDLPWVTNRVQVPETEWQVSLYMLNTVIQVYELQTGKDLLLTAEDIVDLYSVPNEEKQAAFDQLWDWYSLEKGSEKKGLYFAFATMANRQYQEAYGKPFVDKERRLFTAEEEYEVVKWGLEHIDYDLIEKTIRDPEADYLSGEYVRYLQSLGLINERGKPVQRAEG